MRDRRRATITIASVMLVFAIGVRLMFLALVGVSLLYRKRA